MSLTLVQKLKKIQENLKAPKNLWNNYSGFAYRNCESIFEALKPLEKEYNVALVLTDEIVMIGDRYYVKSIARLYDTEAAGTAPIEITAYAREPLSKKGFDESQLTGSASSYARKYALSGMLLLDDIKDADTNEAHVGEKITTDMVEQLKAEISDIGLEEEKVLNAFGAKNFSDFTVSQFNTALKRLEATRRKTVNREPGSSAA